MPAVRAVLPSSSRATVEPVGESLWLLRADDARFVTTWRAKSDLATIGPALTALNEAATALQSTPLLVVPFMGPTGAVACNRHCVSWVDASGNAHVDAPPMFVHVEGKPNRFAQRGRPSNPFAPKSARVTRYLLSDPQSFRSEREIAAATDMDRSYVGRVVGRLERLELLVRDEHGGVRPTDPRALREAWAERYDFEHHTILRGNVAARTGEELTNRVSEFLADATARHAATGLAAAWLLAPFASFRVVTWYVEAPLDAGRLADLGFRENPSGANLWLVVPDDEGVFHGSSRQGGIPCVAPVQAWLDLGAHHERAAEAAEHLRKSLLDR